MSIESTLNFSKNVTYDKNSQKSNSEPLWQDDADDTTDITDTMKSKPVYVDLSSDDVDILTKNEIPSHQGVAQIDKDPMISKHDPSSATNSEDESYDFNSLIFKKLKSSQSQTRQGNGPFTKQSLKLPSKCKNLLIGDSNLKNVRRRQLDSSGQTHVRTYRGCHVESLTRIIDNSEFEYPSVEKVSFCVGTNDCQQSTIDEEAILHKIDQLVRTSKSVFPNASIAINAIPPQGRIKANIHISHLNTKIANLCRHNNIKFLSCETLWAHVNTTTGQIDRGLILPDGIHFHNTGLGLFLKNTKTFFQLDRHGYAPSRKSPHLTTVFNNSLLKNPHGKERIESLLV